VGSTTSDSALYKAGFLSFVSHFVEKKAFHPHISAR